MAGEEASGPDAELIRAAYEAWDLHDLTAFLDLVAEDAEWVPPSYAPERGPHRGREGIERAVEAYREGFAEFRPVPERIIAGDPPGRYLALVRTHTRGKESGIETVIEVGHVIDVRDGRLVRLEIHADREDAHRAAGLEPPAEAGPAT